MEDEQRIVHIIEDDSIPTSSGCSSRVSLVARPKSPLSALPDDSQLAAMERSSQQVNRTMTKMLKREALSINRKLLGIQRAKLKGITISEDDRKKIWMRVNRMHRLSCYLKNSEMAHQFFLTEVGESNDFGYDSEDDQESYKKE